VPNGRNRSGLVKFDLFELDLTTGELRKQGRPLRFQPQPFKVLATLVSNPGKLITREELKNQVWQETTFVDFEQGLNFCVRRIRTVLDDNADAPRFIETVPRRGYRFIAAVEHVSASPEPASEPANGKPSLEVPPREITIPPKTAHGFDGLAAGLALLIIGAISMAWFGQSAPSFPRVLGIVAITNDGRQKITNTPYDFLTPLVSDGSRLFFNETESDHSGIAQVAMSGGDTEPLATPFRSAQLAGISPDHAHILLADMYSPTIIDSPFYSMPVIGGTAKRLGDFAGHDATWSPDGQALAYASKDELDVAGKDGVFLRKVIGGVGIPWWPRWSVDGKKLRFTLNDPKTQSNSIWEVRSDGTHLRPILPAWNNPPNECCGSWTSDGRYFIFQATRDETTSIWALREGTGILRSGFSEPVQLTNGPMSTYVPLPSPDGKKIYLIGVKNRGEMMRYEARKRQFVPFLPGISALDVEFSHDGRSIVYVQYPGLTLWRARQDGTERLQLTSSPFRARLPRWSPDGKQLAFFGSIPGKPWKVYLLAAEGGQPQQLQQMLSGEGNEGDPSWSPDGASLAFGRLPWKTGSTEPIEIYTMDLKSRRVSTVPGSDGLFSPRWSPNGKYLLATKADSSAFLVFDIANQSWTVLAHGAMGYPYWSRDSNYIYFGDLSVPHRASVKRIRIRDGNMETIADLSTVRQTADAWLGCGPDDLPITVREVGTEEIYALDWTAH
jgi:Tol biopolymer transport system component/DNA-binding winged helix-turn-helix (wHTH) protein